VVLDDSPPELQIEQDPRYRLISTEENIGISAGRNRLLSQVSTKVVALFDDDFIVGPEAQLGVLAELVLNGHCDLVAGAVRETSGFWNGGWIYTQAGSVLKKRHAAHSLTVCEIQGKRVELFRVDQVNNAFVARTEFVRSIGWDDALKLREHDDFALRAASLGVVAYTPQAIVDHRPSDPPGYREIREDSGRYHEHFLRKWNLSGVEKEQEWATHSATVPRPVVI
jgi:hypothetical protein